MKKFFFVALIGAGFLVACNDTTTTMTHEDSVKYNDSVAAATSTPSTMGSDTTGTTTPLTNDSSSTMMSDSGSTMMSDSSHK